MQEVQLLDPTDNATVPIAQVVQEGALAAENVPGDFEKQDEPKIDDVFAAGHWRATVVPAGK